MKCCNERRFPKRYVDLKKTYQHNFAAKTFDDDIFYFHKSGINVVFMQKSACIGIFSRFLVNQLVFLLQKFFSEITIYELKMPNTHNMQNFLGYQMLNAIKEKGWRNSRKNLKVKPFS